MDIFEALKWCYEHPFKELSVVGSKYCQRIYYNYNGGFIVQFINNKNQTISEIFELNRDIIGKKFEPVIEKVPLKDLFERWLDGETIYCDIDKKEKRLQRDSLAIDITIGFREVSPVLAKQPIWYIKGVAYDNNNPKG